MRRDHHHRRAAALGLARKPQRHARRKRRSDSGIDYHQSESARPQHHLGGLEHLRIPVAAKPPRKIHRKPAMVIHRCPQNAGEIDARGGNISRSETARTFQPCDNLARACRRRYETGGQRGAAGADGPDDLADSAADDAAVDDGIESRDARAEPAMLGGQLVAAKDASGIRPWIAEMIRLWEHDDRHGPIFAFLSILCQKDGEGKSKIIDFSRTFSATIRIAFDPGVSCDGSQRPQGSRLRGRVPDRWNSMRLSLA